MDISYEFLPSAKTGWRDGLHWLEDLEAWSKEYGDKNTVPEENLGLINVPRIFHAVGMQFVAALLDRQLRQAMMLQEPYWLIQKALDTAVILRKFLIKHFLLPRPHFLRSRWLTSEPDPSGRYHFLQYIGHPWYINPTFTRRWNFNSWVLWLTGGYVPSKYHPEHRLKGTKSQS
ncbi:hypothetical protein N7493_004175 [Penicillium malachiteum]|uniref:Uncharacterized protein n=1 Tax=Penicillium malachiteum TaxID=1324776 RepID=A0AAD6MYI2_9EURO|nr:hypothetical protein N7493_004175 [Penicillium malachiteum]